MEDLDRFIVNFISLMLVQYITSFIEANINLIHDPALIEDIASLIGFIQEPIGLDDTLTIALSLFEK